MLVGAGTGAEPGVIGDLQQQIAAAGPALAREVRRFQARNRYLGLADKMYWQLRKISVRNWLRS